MTRDHHPDLADQRAALATARAMLTGDDQAAHDAATSESCPACTTIAGISFLIATTSTLAGEKLVVSRELASVLLAAVQAAQLELDSSAN